MINFFVMNIKIVINIGKWNQKIVLEKNTLQKDATFFSTSFIFMENNGIDVFSSIELL